MKNALVFTTTAILVLSVFGCTTEKPKPQSKWEVSVSTDSRNKVWVWKHDDSKQCGGAAKLTPDIAAREAKSAGLMVYQFRKDSDGMMYPSVCGGRTGATVELEIPSQDLTKAVAMGYKPKTQN